MQDRELSQSCPGGAAQIRIIKKAVGKIAKPSRFLPSKFQTAVSSFLFVTSVFAAGFCFIGCDGGDEGKNRRASQDELRKKYQTSPRQNARLNHLEAAVRSGLSGGNVEVYCDLAGAYFSRGQYARAIAVYQKAIQIAPDLVRANYNLGKVYQKIGKPNEAITQFSRSIELNPDFADAYLSLGAAYGQRAPMSKGTPTHVIYKDLEKAVEYCAKAVEMEPTNAFFQYNLARAYDVNNRSGEAAAAYQLSLELGTDRVEVHKHLGSIYADQDHLEQAVDSFRQFIRYDSTDAEVHYMLGKVLDRQGNSKEALVAYQRSIVLKPDVPDPHYNLGKAYHRMGRAQEGQRALERFEALKARGGDRLGAAQMDVQQVPDGVEERRNLAVVYAQKGHYEEALDHLQVALTLDPGVAPQIYHDMGLIYARQGADEKALQVLKKAVKLAPDSTRFHLRLAQIYAKLEQNSLAEQAFKQVLVLAPDQVKPLYELAMLYVRGWRYEEAAPLFEQILAAEPHHVDARYGLSLVYINTERYAEAAAGFERVINLQPDYPRAHEYLAAARKRQ